MSEKFYRIVLRVFLAIMLALVAWLAVSDMPRGSNPGPYSPGIFEDVRASMILLFLVGIVAVAIGFVLVAVYRTLRESRKKDQA